MTEQRTAIVTGGSRGIGRAVAERLARDGLGITLTFRERADAAREVVERIEASGGQAQAIRADLADAVDIDAIFQAHDSRFGRLDVLVLNAAHMRHGGLVDVTEEEFDLAFAVNARAAFLAYRLAAPRLTSGGRIIAISTGLTQNPMAGVSAYAASKAALEVLTRCFAHELGPRGITVNVLQPGITNTEALFLEPAVIDALVGQTPLGRLGEPEDLAAVVSLLASSDAGWITGDVIRASGGLR
jgi:3-oxoacyl-[acyl-carrier protein] reductase